MPVLVSEAMLPEALRLLANLDPGFVWIAALLVAFAYALRSARLDALDPRGMYWAGVCALLGGLWVSHWTGLYVYGTGGDPLVALRFWTGGKTFFGALLGGACAGALFLHVLRLPILPYADAVAPAVALGYSIGRLGCFLNGDDFGTLTRVPWSVQYPPGTEAFAAHVTRGWIASSADWSLRVHPVQLYLALVGLTLFVLLTRARRSFPGSRAMLYFIVYGAARFSLEWLRGDFVPVFGPFSLWQLSSLLLIGAGVGMRIHVARQHSVAVPSFVSAKPMSL